MESSEKHGEHTAKERSMQNRSNVDEKEIEIQHQFQMFPTPDEKRASEVITELKD
ncbi:hypothetical protein [Brevibacillus sp. NRS-1366]|uniref:hypothetical protein n=1 Tax=Brevibacillus sp. NRS-1366 TaxID=3233899 RepID=UPI003D24B23D